MSSSQKWITLEKGIRYKEHPERKHGKKFDRYYVLRYSANGKMNQEALGWASDGITLEKARVKLAELREAHRSGSGAQTLAEQRLENQLEKKNKESQEKLEKAKSITFGEYWENVY